MISNLFTEVVMAVVLCYVIYVKKGQIKGMAPARYPKIKKNHEKCQEAFLFLSVRVKTKKKFTEGMFRVLYIK